MEDVDGERAELADFFKAEGPVELFRRGEIGKSSLRAAGEVIAPFTGIGPFEATASSSGIDCGSGLTGLADLPLSSEAELPE